MFKPGLSGRVRTEKIPGRPHIHGVKWLSSFLQTRLCLEAPSLLSFSPTGIRETDKLGFDLFGFYTIPPRKAGCGTNMVQRGAFRARMLGQKISIDIAYTPENRRRLF